MKVYDASEQFVLLVLGGKKVDDMIEDLLVGALSVVESGRIDQYVLSASDGNGVGGSGLGF